MLTTGRGGRKPTLCVLEVMAPQRSDLVLTPDVPDSEADVLVLHRLYVETCEETQYKHVAYIMRKDRKG